MKKVVIYKTPQEFLDDNIVVLEKNELDNNLILGICQSYKNKSEEQKNSIFLSTKDNEGNIICSIKNTQIALLGGNTNKSELLSRIITFYNEEKIELSGVFGRADIAKSFTQQSKRTILKSKAMLSHKLKTLNKIKLSEGNFELCTIEDSELLCKLVNNFHEELCYYPKKDIEQIKEANYSLIKTEKLYKWVVNNKIVSIAGQVRNTRNIGIVGLVYTPFEQRGKGYATSIVHGLSKRILNSGYFYSGLFTDIENPTSNKIYKNIGYNAESNFTQIIFK